MAAKGKSKPGPKAARKKAAPPAKPKRKSPRPHARTPRAEARAKAAAKPADARRRSATARTGETEAERLAYRIGVTERICALYSNTNSTIASCCEECGIDVDTFWRWRAEHAELRELFEKAVEQHRKRRFEGLREKLLSSFEQLVVGCEVEDVVQEAEPGTDKDGKPALVVKLVRKTKRHILPNAGMVAMGMKNLHGFTDGVGVQVTGPVGTFIIGGKEFAF